MFSVCLFTGGGHPLEFQILPQDVTSDGGVERDGGISVQIPDFFWKKIGGGGIFVGRCR